MFSKMKIGIFDSGIGGLTILDEVRRLLPRENILYYGDFKNTPYGEKNKEEILNLAFKIVGFMVKNHCKVIIVGCSLFSAAALKELQEKFEIPIIGVIESGVKTALIESDNKNIGLLAPSFTVETGIYTNTFNNLNSSSTIYEVSCEKLCHMIETGWKAFSEGNKLLEFYLSKLPRSVDTIILGGTHYPLIKEDIKKLTDLPVVDCAREVVIDLLDILITRSILNREDKKGRIEFCIDGDTELLERGLETYFRKVPKDNIYRLI